MRVVYAHHKTKTQIHNSLPFDFSFSPALFLFPNIAEFTSSDRHRIMASWQIFPCSPKGSQMLIKVLEIITFYANNKVASIPLLSHSSWVVFFSLAAVYCCSSPHWSSIGIGDIHKCDSLHIWLYYKLFLWKIFKSKRIHIIGFQFNKFKFNFILWKVYKF